MDTPDSGDPQIRRAIRRSLLLLALIAVAVGGVAWWSSRRPPRAPADSSPPTPPATSNRAEVARPFVSFRDLARERGVDFVHQNGATGRKLLPETLGGGVAVEDLDGDGAAEILLVDGDRWEDAPPGSPAGRGIVLFRNDGAGSFAVPSSPTGLEAPLQGMGIALGDADGDGDLDLLVTSTAGVRFFRNESAPGVLRFVDATEASGLASLDGWSTSAGFGDLDLDGDLDLVVAHYVRWNPTIDEAVDYRLEGIGRAYGPPLGFEGETVRAFFNSGDGTFEDRTAAAGFDVRNPSTGAPMAKALGLLVQDLDGDGDLDVFVANDTVANFLLRNRGDGTFEEVGTPAGIAFDRLGAATGAMGVDLAMLGRGEEARRAIVVGNFANEPTSFFLEDPSRAGRYGDEAIPQGISAATRPTLTFGMLWADLDGEGGEEIVAANGHLEEEIARLQASQSYRQPAQIFRGSADGGGFELVPDASLGDLARPVVGRGLASGDLDLDGDVDLVLTQIAGAPMVLFNDLDEVSPHRRWIRLELVGPRGDASVVGAGVRIVDGDREILRTVAPTRSYLSQVERALTIGLGEGDAGRPIDRVEVEWTGGGRTVLEQVPANGRARVEGAGSSP